MASKYMSANLWRYINSVKAGPLEPSLKALAYFADAPRQAGEEPQLMHLQVATAFIQDGEQRSKYISPFTNIQTLTVRTMQTNPREKKTNLPKKSP
jgi:hypothetical protein